MIGNFNANYIPTGFYTAGYFDIYNVGTADFIDDNEKTNSLTASRATLRDDSSPNFTKFELLFRPPAGILNSMLPLLTNTEMTISFDRAISDLSIISFTENGGTNVTGKALDLKQVFLKARYYSSPFLRNYFDSVKDSETIYAFDEIVVYNKNLPQGETNIRLSNIIGGNTPSYLFAGIIEAKALAGNNKMSSTCFKRYNVSEFDLTLNGYSCNGFPVISTGGSPINNYDMFLATTGRKFQANCGSIIEPLDFKDFHYIYSHKFNAENSENGWIGVNIKLESEYSENYVLGKIFFANKFYF